MLIASTGGSCIPQFMSSNPGFFQGSWVLWDIVSMAHEVGRSQDSE